MLIFIECEINVLNYWFILQYLILVIVVLCEIDVFIDILFLT